MRSKLTAFVVRAVMVLCALIVFVSVTFIFFAVGPALETRWNPVTTKVDILSLEPGPNGTSIVRAAFRKLRECEYIGVAWYVGSREEGFERVSLIVKRDEADTSSPSRPLGYQKAGPWIIGMPPEDLRNRSFAQLTHKCHPFWYSVTDFFP